MRTAGKWTRILGIGATVFLLLGIAVGIAGAQRPDSGSPARGDGPGGPSGTLRDEYARRLADNLGLPEETVREALAKTRDDMRPLLAERRHEIHERLHDLSQDPRLRERLFERMQERFRGDDGRPPFGPGGFERGMPPFGPGGPPPIGLGDRPGGAPVGPDLVGLAAEILNLSPEVMRRELEAGKTLAQVAQEHGVSPSSLGDQLTARLEQRRIQSMREGIERMLQQPVRQRDQP